MNHRSNAVVRMLAAAGVALFLGAGPAQAKEQADAQQVPFMPPVSPLGNARDPSKLNPMRRTTMAQRIKAAQSAAQRRKEAEDAGLLAPAPKVKLQAPRPKASGTSGGTSLNGAARALLSMAMAQVGTPDYYASPNFATSKYPIAHCAGPGAVTTELCQKDADCTGYLPPFLIGPDLYPSGATCTGPVVPGTGIQKFVDTLPGLCPLGGSAINDLNNCIPLAVPDKASFPGSDYYEIGLKDFTTQFHRDLAHGTKVRGYYQKNTSDPYSSKPYYLGPLILAKTNTPVRMKFVNELGLGAAGNLFVPMDDTLSGTNVGADGLPYTQNRATVHLHGGNTPWISDGTQHQWTVPAGETTTHKKGLSVAYVPDMWFDAAGAAIPSCEGQQTCAASGATNDPGDGALTFYYTNQQSGRLMFYHDHAYGITRLGVYSGEAAGYLLVNPPDEDRLAAATVPGTIGTTPDLAHMVPFIIQDRTFVPPAAQLAQQDPTWDAAKWSGEDGLWLPHVYMTNQWPGNPDLSNTNPMGRWDYGPWFWPVQTSLVEVDHNGVAASRPLTVPCTSAAAVTGTNPTGATDCPSTPLPSLVPEAFMDTPVVNGTAYPTFTVDPVAYRFQMLNAANERNFNLSLFVADASGTEVTLVPAVPHLSTSTPVALCSGTAPLSAVTGTPNGPDLATPTCWPREWPTDGRQGGVPDPATAGPQWVQLASEGGLLPSPAVIPPRPVVYEQNKRNIVVLNVANKSLFLGPAERADVVVDFSAYAGKTLIVYNDAPAPVPAGDPRQDFWTGGPDFTTAGGSPTPLPGYGPNTRTVMQIKVRATPLGGAQPALNLASITTAVRQSFAASLPMPIVPEAAYNPVYNPAVPYTDTYPQIQTLSLDFTPMGEAASKLIKFENKALHELFTTNYGRMNSLLGVEIPNTNWVNQTTIPFANFDPPTEYLPNDQQLIWKITHNGVDTHTIHFHLFNVQIVDRVGWDGAVRPPDANELGWKESVRMNPLEDVILALRPVKQNLPWPLPDMIRPLDVDRAIGSASQFTAVDIFNNPIAVTNVNQNYGQEYVWHCHLLGHEEEDMLRAEILVVPPETPTGLTVTTTGNPGEAKLDWTDASVSAQGFTVQRDTTPLFTTNPAVSFAVGVPAKEPGPVTYTDTTAVAGPTYYYRVRAEKVLSSLAVKAGPAASDPVVQYQAPSAWTAAVQFGTAPIAGLAPASLAFGIQAVNVASAAQDVTLSNTGTATLNIGAIGFTGANATDFSSTTTCGATLAAAASCTISVTFAPAVAGPRAASLSVASNDPFNPTLAVALTGTGAGAAAAIAPASLTFAAQGLNSTSAAQTATLTNNGTTALTVTSITATGTNASDFGVTTSCGASLAAAGSCTISVTFTPSASGARAASVSVVTSDPVNPTLTVALAGSGIPAATGVTLTSDQPSPHTNGLAVKFTAVGSGPAGIPASAWQYQFSLNGTVVQVWGAASTWTLPSAQLTGTYNIKAEVRTSSGAATADATASIAYQINNPVATGVTLVADATKPSPHINTTPVTFTATGLGSNAYQYLFRLWDPSGNVTLAQNYSATNTWTMPAGLAPGTYGVQVWVRTSSAVTLDTSTTLYYTLAPAPATSVTLAPDPAKPSPQANSTSVVFTATGSGSSGYQYLFRLWDPAGNVTTVQNYSALNTWTMPTGLSPGTYYVQVWVRTSSLVTLDTFAAIPYTLVLPPATGVTLVPEATKPSPHSATIPVTFTATASGSSGYQYQFRLWDPTGNGTFVQIYSTNNSWTMPAGLTPGNYVVQVWVRTSTQVVLDTHAEINYTLTP